MEIKVGDYIRTKDGYIDRVKELGDQDEDLKLIVRGENHTHWKDKITKHNEDLKHLIEVGDIVNGKKVIEIREQDDKIYLMTDYVPQKYIKYEIKEILTHEFYEKNYVKF